MDVTAGSEELSALELLILRSASRARDLKDLAKAAKTSPSTLGREIAKLQIAGFLGEDGAVTVKGLKALQGQYGEPEGSVSP